MRKTHTQAPIYVKPVPLNAAEVAEFGSVPRIVRDPDRGYEPMPAEGGFVPPNDYWLSQLRDGSVVRAKPADETTPAPKPNPAAAPRRPAGAAAGAKAH